MVEKITYKGLRKLDAMEISTIYNLTEKNFPKIQRHFSNASLTIDIKKAAVAGTRARYTILLRLAAPTKIMLSAEHTDWDLTRAIHRAFDNVKNEAKHRFKVGISIKRRQKNFRG
ncbi:MAG: hypothetical protein KKA79_08620 [Nanoarchaeota archaeon]|nr:hypothetical protein [Nanoarchaeota archaeon]MCG2719044.1 hypothetical protein [Nanoarchaeota archaeon]